MPEPAGPINQKMDHPHSLGSKGETLHILEGEIKVKIFLFALLTLSLLAVCSSTGQAYDPYYYEPDLQYLQPLQPYDPYYELHQIHYQLYLREYYPYYYRYYPLIPAQVFIIRDQLKENRPGRETRKR